MWMTIFWGLVAVVGGVAAISVLGILALWFAYLSSDEYQLERKERTLGLQGEEESQEYCDGWRAR